MSWFPFLFYMVLVVALFSGTGIGRYSATKR